MEEFNTPVGLLSSRGENWNINVDTSGNLTFNADSLTDGTTRMVINDETGNVGIGRSNPQAKLDVNGTFRVNEGTIFSRIQAGTATVGNSTSRRKNIVVNFPTPFSNPPKVIATEKHGQN
ncbi:MAG: hypothetical protein QNJ65_21630 [Xenococcaceae cyanobacterium MO_234.B1]|nr:hypothetical protein [Xenococcaceae cyanobacterium MO_234.B1]